MQRLNGREGMRIFRMPMECIEFVASGCMLGTTEVDNSVCGHPVKPRCGLNS